MGLLVVGSVALDNILTDTEKVENVLGGSACYFACAASYLAPVQLVGVAGKDFPKKYIDFLKSKNIDINGLEIAEGKTFRWTGKYSTDLSQRETLSVELNVFEKFNPVLPEEYKKAEYVFLANIDPKVQKQVMQQVKKPKLVVMDTMNIWIEIKRDELIEALKQVDILILNDEEAKMLAQKNCLLACADEILKMGIKQVIIKKASNGAFLKSKNEYFCLPSYPVYKLKDTTGAGDAFGGGFMGYLAKTNDLSKENIRRAIAYGTVTASFAVEGFSLDRLGSISLEDIEDRARELKQITEF
ncbi:bifunctional hydroxymethylpyrimidine kinase/phosphomethylpyrimidine kinase [bacterium]|nr:bifunctional hydroxymethylpyrimidine kinase/phosphomethylpyrimidine kinase [bacterium]